MRTLTPTVLLTSILSTFVTGTGGVTLTGSPGALMVWSHQGTMQAPAAGAAIKPGDEFAFSYRQANMCKDDAVTVSSYLSGNPPTQESVLSNGQLEPGSFVYHFGDWTASNWGEWRSFDHGRIQRWTWAYMGTTAGLPSNNPPPATLVMPVLDGTQPGTPLWFIVVENYANCPVRASHCSLSLWEDLTPGHSPMGSRTGLDSRRPRCTTTDMADLDGGHCCGQIVCSGIFVSRG